MNKKGRKSTFEATPSRIYMNTLSNLSYKYHCNHITKVQHIKLFAEAKIKMLTDLEKIEQERKTNE